MKNTADNFYYFFVSLKYTLKQTNTKASKTIILTAIACYPIMYVTIKSVQSDNIFLPMTYLFQVISYLFLGFICLSLFSFLITTWRFYEPLIWFLSGIAFLGFAYILIIMEYIAFLIPHISPKKQALVFDILLVIPIVCIIISFGRYIQMIYVGKTHKNQPNVILLEKKYSGQKNLDMEHNTNKNFLLFATFIGVALGGMIETSLTIFIVFLVCAYFISWIVPRIFIISYAKFKFPEQYLEKNLNPSYKKERKQKE